MLAVEPLFETVSLSFEKSWRLYLFTGDSVNSEPLHLLAKQSRLFTVVTLRTFRGAHFFHENLRSVKIPYLGVITDAKLERRNLTGMALPLLHVLTSCVSNKVHVSDLMQHQHETIYIAVTTSLEPLLIQTRLKSELKLHVSSPIPSVANDILKASLPLAA